jgi:hypothetical protein
MVAVRDPAPNIRLPRDKTINKNLQTKKSGYTRVRVYTGGALLCQA